MHMIYNIYTMELNSLLLEYFEIFFCMTLIALPYKKRENFIWRYILAFAAGVAMSVLLAVWKTPYNVNLRSPAAICVRLISYILIAIYVLVALLVCYRENVMECITCWCIAVAIKTLAAQSHLLLLNLMGIDTFSSLSFIKGAPRWANYLAIAVWHAVIFVAFAYLNMKRRRPRYDRHMALTVTLLSFFIAFITNALTSFLRLYEGESTALTIICRMFTVICSGFVLAQIYVVSERNSLNADLEITEQLLRQEQRRYMIAKDSVEAINMKVHNLKHRLNDLEVKLNENELEALRQAVNIYDSNIKTGSDILDAVLYEKQIYCEHNGVKLTCLADGRALSFMSPSHIYALFSNAIDNATEAAVGLADDDRRIVGITTARENGDINIEIYNYFDGNIVLENSLPVSTKADGNHHGYGMKSMQYIVSTYKGTLTADVEGDMFTLKITLPIRGK